MFRFGWVVVSRKTELSDFMQKKNGSKVYRYFLSSFFRLRGGWVVQQQSKHCSDLENGTEKWTPPNWIIVLFFITSSTSPHMWLADGDSLMCYIVMMSRKFEQHDLIISSFRGFRLVMIFVHQWGNSRGCRCPLSVKWDWPEKLSVKWDQSKKLSVKWDSSIKC